MKLTKAKLRHLIKEGFEQLGEELEDDDDLRNSSEEREFVRQHHRQSDEPALENVYEMLLDLTKFFKDGNPDEEDIGYAEEVLVKLSNRIWKGGEDQF